MIFQSTIHITVDGIFHFMFQASNIRNIMMMKCIQNIGLSKIPHNFLLKQFKQHQPPSMHDQSEISDVQLVKPQMIHHTPFELINSGNLLISKSIEKGRESRFEFEKFINIDLCLLMFCITNIFLALIYYEADYISKTDAIKKKVATWCLLITDIMCPLQILATIIRYWSLMSLEKSQKVLDEQETIYSSGKVPSILIEIGLLLIQPYSFLDHLEITTQNVKNNFSFQYKLNYILVVLGFLKMFIPIRVILIRELYMSPRSSRLCRMYGCESNYLYAIKCLFKDSPLGLIGLVFAISIVIFALSLRIAERNLSIENPKHLTPENIPPLLDKFDDALWLTIITMTTVGYGDFYPRTVFGRAIDVFLVIWGTFIVSLMVVVLTNTLNMDQSQKRALIVLNRLETKKSLKQAAAFVITHSCRKYLINKKVAKRMRPPLTENERVKLESSFYKYLSNFQNIHRKIRSMYEIDDVYEEMTRQFEFINDEVSVLLASQEETIDNIFTYISQEQAKKSDRSKIETASRRGTQSLIH